MNAARGAGALILGGFSVGGTMWFGPASPPSFGFTGFGGEVAGLPGDLLIAAVLVTVAAACLRAPVSRRVLALLAIPVIPYAVLWQEKLAGDLFGSPNGGASTLIPTSVTMTYLLPLILAGLIVAGTWLARHRAIGRARRVGSRTTSAGPRGALRA